MSTLDDSMSGPMEENNSPVVAEPMEDNNSPAVFEPMEENNSSAVTEPMEDNTALGDQLECDIQPTVKSKKSTLRSYRQKAQALQARIKYREKAIKGFRSHLKKGTFPKRFKSLRPYPKMDSFDSQAVVNAACQQVECVILDQMILDEEKKLTQEQAEYQALKKEREGERSQLVKTTTKPQKMSVTQLMQELADLQSKYAQLCQQLNVK